ncbi:MAG: DUF1643 domain-containing protein [Phycisphaerales bacterium]|nr:DUF1643 domain-containing protein [Phycisphaerales bacterium]
MAATFSKCGRFRYRLERVLDPTCDRTVAWVMLNPSTADANTDDQTIRRVRHFSAANFEGVRDVVVVNLYAFRATAPRDLSLADDPQGPRNMWHVRRALESADEVVVGWGASLQAWRHENPSRVLGVLRSRTLWCLGETSSGDPCHPLRIASSRPMEHWTPRL